MCVCVRTFKLAQRVTWHSAPAGTYGPIYTQRLTQHRCLERREENARKKTTKGISPNHYPLWAEECAETSAMLISLLHTRQYTHRSITHGELTFTHTHPTLNTSKHLHRLFCRIHASPRKHLSYMNTHTNVYPQAHTRHEISI